MPLKDFHVSNHLTDDAEMIQYSPCFLYMLRLPCCLVNVLSFAKSLRGLFAPIFDASNSRSLLII